MSQKMRGKVVLTYELLERILGLDNSTILTIENNPDLCSISIIHCDKSTSFPIVEGGLIPITDTFNKTSDIHMCKRCRHREIANAMEMEFKKGDDVIVFVDGAGLKKGIVKEVGEYACRVEIDNWEGIFSCAMMKKEEVHDKSEAHEQDFSFDEEVEGIDPID